MADPKVVKKTTEAEQSSMVIGNKVNWRELSKRATAIKEELVEVHKAISDMWKAQKCRELATVESCVRNTVNYLERLPAAISKFDVKDGSKTGNKVGSVLSKPR